MSNHVSSTCSKRKLDGAPRKQVLMYFADKASDDGSGIWCSKGTIALETELSISTVKRVIRAFKTEKLIIATGKRKNDHGYTVEYAINLDAIHELPELVKTDNKTGGVVNSVKNEPSREVQTGYHAVLHDLQTNLKPSKNLLRASARRGRKF